MRRLSDVLPGVARELGLEEQLQHARAMASWEHLVAELVPGASGESHLLEIRPPDLVVGASSATVAQELRLRSPELLASFATAPGGSRQLALRIVVAAGASSIRRPDKDTWSAPPRPPDGSRRPGRLRPP
jgi:Dna[CI] antecedent, DciA